MTTSEKTKHLVTTAILAATALVLSLLEGFLPPLPIAGAKLGLANVTVMYALTCVSLPSAVGITAVKAVFALTRGVTACAMSTMGGFSALLIMALFYRLCRDKLSYVGFGVLGAVAHNIGQWLVSYALFGAAMRYYAPLLLLLAIPAGLLTGLTLNLTAPYLNRLRFL